MTGFKMNPNFERDLAKQVAGTMQRDIDAVYRQCKGQPVDSVRRALKQKLGASLVEPTLTTVAEAISRGDKVNLTS